ncbi:MAG: flagellar basal body-associated FliL family protein [Pseudomonadota bacterium]
MADVEPSPEDQEEDPPKKASKMPLILGVVLALVGGGSGFTAVQMGLIGGGSSSDEDASVQKEEPAEELPSLAFVPLDQIVVNLPQNAQAKHLLFSAQLEVDPTYAAEVEELMPRIIDVMNGYLRAVELDELEDPTALVRLRSQMLRRIQVVVGDGRVRDLLIMEYVLN